jgi:4,5-dihydroxyphthalate decarboxylase
LRTLTIVVGNHGITQALRDGRVQSERVKLEFVDVGTIVAAMRRMVRTLDFDVCEMALATYLCSLSHNKPLIALPIFVTRNFHHRAIFHYIYSDIKSPRDLEGRIVGVNRGYTVTTGLWARGVLQAEHGVDLNTITWAATDDEHVVEYKPPPNVDYSCRGKSIGDLLRTGEISAAVGDIQSNAAEIAPLLPDWRQMAFDSFRRTGVYPINHGIVIKRSVIDAAPWVADELFRAFDASKQMYLSKLDSGEGLSPADSAIVSVRSIVGHDPFPFGIGSNRRTLEALIQLADEQRVIPKRLPVHALFAPGAN